MSSPPRPLPQPTPESQAFWSGGASGLLRIQRCAQCQRFHHPPLPVCPHCGSFEVAPETVSGRGRVHSYTINHQAWLPGMDIPFVVAYVALAEQADVWLMTNIIGCLPSQVHIGQRVCVHFEQQDDIWIPLFMPDASV
jgi:uncharacterized OB-fold protein